MGLCVHSWMGGQGGDLVGVTVFWCDIFSPPICWGACNCLVDILFYNFVVVCCWSLCLFPHNLC